MILFDTYFLMEKPIAGEKKDTLSKFKNLCACRKRVWVGTIQLPGTPPSKVVLKRFLAFSKMDALYLAKLQDGLSRLKLGDGTAVPKCYQVFFASRENNYRVCFLAMEHIPGADLLTHLLLRCSMWTLPFLVSVFQKTVRLVQGYVKAGIIHNDIRLGHFILDDSNENVVGIDFEHAYYTNIPSAISDYRIESKTYSSPESLLRTLCPATCNMTWALGIMLYYMVYREYPCTRSLVSEDEVRGRLFPNNATHYSETENLQMTLLSSLIQGLLNPRWQTRVSLWAILHHPLFSKKN